VRVSCGSTQKSAHNEKLRRLLNAIHF